MTVAVAAVLVGSFRWERGGGSPLHLRASTPVPRGVLVAWPVAQTVLLLYPVLVAAVPTVAYGTILNFSFPLDSAVQVLGILLWALGAFLLLWCSRLLGPIMTIDGVAVGQELVTRGPFAVIRHPTYTAHILLALGATALFLSYVLLGVSLLTIVLARSLARHEEQLLASPEGFGEAYRGYMTETGRFLPRFKFRRRSG